MAFDPCEHIKVKIEKTDLEIKNIEKEIKNNKRDAAEVGDGEEPHITLKTLHWDLEQQNNKKKSLLEDLNNCIKENQTDFGLNKK